jgi:histone-arginine methyltransferase CARM1
MLQDTVRTGTYQQAILSNPDDFKDKVVLYVGCGTGILSIFAAQAGAKRVYAVEASDMADMAVLLIAANGLHDVVRVIKGKIEEIEVPEKVDVIISEPMGFMLVHERMLESYIVARERFLKPQPAVPVPGGSRMFPSRGTIRVMPFSDWQLHNEQAGKTMFWRTTDFFGVNMTALEGYAIQQSFAQPVIGYVDPNQFIAHDDQMASHTIDFDDAKVVDDLGTIEIPFSFKISRNSLMHGVCCWFDVDFLGSNRIVTLSTSPRLPGTHWYQIRLLLPSPLGVNAGQTVGGRVLMKVNKKFSYDVLLDCRLQGTAEKIASLSQISLHDPYYHYLSSPASPPSSADRPANPYASWVPAPKHAADDNGDDGDSVYTDE